MLRDLGRALNATAGQLSRPRTVATVVGITVLVAVALLVPLPTPVQLRDWAESVGPWFPLAFLGAHYPLGRDKAGFYSTAPLEKTLSM